MEVHLDEAKELVSRMTTLQQAETAMDVVEVGIATLAVEIDELECAARALLREVADRQREPS